MLQTGRTQQVAAGVDADALDVVVADFAQLKGGLDVAVEVVLLLGDLDPFLRCQPNLFPQVRVGVLPAGVQIGALPRAINQRLVQRLALWGGGWMK